jgi:hypothetical protein
VRFACVRKNDESRKRPIGAPRTHYLGRGVVAAIVDQHYLNLAHIHCQEIIEG